MSGPSDIYFHVFHENPFTFPFECIQRHMITCQVALGCFKSMSDFHKIHLQRLGLPIPFSYLILLTNDLHLYRRTSPKSVTVISFDYHEHSCMYFWNVNVKIVPSIVVVRKITHQ